MGRVGPPRVRGCGMKARRMWVIQRKSDGKFYVGNERYTRETPKVYETRKAAKRECIFDTDRAVPVDVTVWLARKPKGGAR